MTVRDVIPPTLLPAVRDYLKSTGSLTALLEQLAGQPLKVVVLHEGFHALTFDQKQQLQLPTNQRQLAWVRTVLLFGDDARPWVKASSIFPLSTLRGELTRLRHLKSTPIGYVLFKHHRQLPHTRSFYHTDVRQYGRRTVYHYPADAHDTPGKLLIDECFLETLITRLPNAHEHTARPAYHTKAPP